MGGDPITARYEPVWSSAAFANEAAFLGVALLSRRCPSGQSERRGHSPQRGFRAWQSLRP